jgi:hypothetical protein
MNVNITLVTTRTWPGVGRRLAFGVEDAAGAGAGDGPSDGFEGEPLGVIL